MTVLDPSDIWNQWRFIVSSINPSHGPLARYVKLRVVHAPGMPGTFTPPPRVSDPDMHHVTCVTHVPWCMPRSLINGFLWSRWWGKRSRHSRRMHNPRFFVCGKRPMPVSSPIQIQDMSMATTVSADILVPSGVRPSTGPVMTPRPGPLFNIKTVFPRYGDSFVKDKTIERPSYL